MVDCPTEDVPFREGTFGGAESVVSIPTPGFPFLAYGGSSQASHLPSPEAKAKPAHLSYEVAGCATGSARTLKRPSNDGGLQSLYSSAFTVIVLQLRRLSDGEARHIRQENYLLRTFVRPGV
jgi:hypothetical protein